MREKELKSGILYLLKVAQEERVPMGKVRLMKLLYLLDVDYYRYHGETYTGLEWLSYKYGPFAFEVETLLGEIGVKHEEIPLEKGKSLKQLKYDFDVWGEDIKPSFKAKGILHNLFKDWGVADLNRLLDYVYFDTEPMEGVQFRKKLDFSKIIPHKREGKIAISPSTRKKLRKICRRIKRSLDEIETPPEVHLMSSQDIEITSIWNREEVARIGSLQGIVKFGKRQQR